MDIDQLMFAAAVMMTATAIAIGIAKKLNLGSIVALLAVGMALGPHSPRPLLTGHVDEVAFVIFASAHASGLLSAGAYTGALAMISFSFILSPLLIGLGYKLCARLAAMRKPEAPSTTISESIHDRVVVVGYSYTGRTICAMLEVAKVPYIAFEIDLTRLSDAKKWGHNAHYGDVTEPTMMGTISIARARSVILTTSVYESTRRMIGNLRQFYPSVPVMPAVQFLFQRDELRRMGATHVVALTPEGILDFSRAVLSSLGVATDKVDSIVSSFGADDYAVMRGLTGVGPDTAAQEGGVVPQFAPAGVPPIRP